MKFALVFAIGIYLLANCHAAVPEKTPKSQIFCSMRSVDLALVLDQSTSIEADEFLELRKFAIDLIARVKAIGSDGTRIAAVCFGTGSQTVLEFSPSQTKRDVEEFFRSYNRDNYAVGGGTYIGLAMEHTINNVFAGTPVRPRYMIVVTDGASSDSVAAAAQQAKRRQITTISVGVGPESSMNPATLKEIANWNTNHVFTVQTFSDLKSIVGEICDAVEGPTNEHLQGVESTCLLALSLAAIIAMLIASLLMLACVGIGVAWFIRNQRKQYIALRGDQTIMSSSQDAEQGDTKPHKTPRNFFSWLAQKVNAKATVANEQELKVIEKKTGLNSHKLTNGSIETNGPNAIHENLYHPQPGENQQLLGENEDNPVKFGRKVALLPPLKLHNNNSGTEERNKTVAVTETEAASDQASENAQRSPDPITSKPRDDDDNEKCRVFPTESGQSKVTVEKTKVPPKLPAKQRTIKMEGKNTEHSSNNVRNGAVPIGPGSSARNLNLPVNQAMGSIVGRAPNVNRYGMA